MPDIRVMTESRDNVLRVRIEYDGDYDLAIDDYVRDLAKRVGAKWFSSGRMWARSLGPALIPRTRHIVIGPFKGTDETAQFCAAVRAFEEGTD